MKKILIGLFASVVAVSVVPVMAQDFNFYDLYVMDLHRGSVARVTSIPDAGEFNPDWSPDGRFLVHDVKTVDTHSLYITDVSRRRSTPLTGADGGDDAAWGPNGYLIAFDRVPYGDNSLYVLPRAGGIPRAVVADGADPSWNPWGTALAFTRPSDGSIRTVKLRGGEERFLGYGQEPSWSPDGRWVVFTQSGDLWKVPMDRNGNPTGPGVAVTDGPAWDGQPTWSGDSRTIYFHSNRNIDFDIWKVSTNGGTPQLVTGLVGAGDYDPAVSPDGQKLVFDAVGPGSSVISPPFARSDKPYSIGVQPLKGPESTDIYVRVYSTDPVKFPIPSVLEKLTIRVLDRFRRCTLNRSFSNLPISDGIVVVNMRGLGLLEPLRVEALLPGAGGRPSVATAIASVLQRPDLIVQGVNAPGEYPKFFPFNVEALVREKTIRVGTNATVGLYEGNTQLGSVPGVWVTGGSQVSVVFEGIRLADPGVHSLTVRISNADPAEGNVSNNEFSFQVNVLDVTGTEPMQYSMSYSNSHTTYQDQFRSCWMNYDQTTESDSRAFSYSGWLYTPYEMPGPPFDLFAWRIAAEGGVWDEGSSPQLVPLNSYDDGTQSFEYYSINLNPAKPLFAYLYVSRSGGSGSLSISISQYANRNVYRRTENGSVTESTYEDGWPGLLATQTVSASVLMRDDGVSAGGGAALTVTPNPAYTVAWQNSGYDEPNGCTYQEDYSFVSESSGGFSSGETDPTQLPLAKTSAGMIEAGRDDAPAVAHHAELLPVYPNPFNPSTTVSFSVEREGTATVEVFNIIGERVGELFNGFATPGRNYRVVFDGGRLPSGMYIARLQSNGKNFVTKMMLSK